MKARFALFLLFAILSLKLSVVFAQENIFTVWQPDYQKSPYTGMTRQHWIQAGEYLLKGAFNYIHTLDDQMYFPKQLDKTYPRNTGEIPVAKLEGLALDAMKKTDEYVATLEEGLKVDPDNKTMIKNYGLHYLKAGIAAQKAGKAEEAEECFKKVIPLDHKTYKTNALYSLGVLCYNDGANILKKAAPLANSDADKYAAEKEKADGRFKEAIGYLEEATKVSPEDTKSKTMLSQVQAAMK